MRAEQMAVLAELMHAAQVDPAFLALLDELVVRSAELSEAEQADVRECKWQSDRLRRLPRGFLAERARIHANGRAAWAEARAKNDFAVLAPVLEHVIAIEREFAALVDASQDPYQVLLEEYEPGATVEELSVLFASLEPALRELVERAERVRLRRLEPWPGPFPKETQRSFNLRLLEWLGFDFRFGRLDESLHPFSITLGHDHRITTRYDEADLREALFSTLHEAGHALYEQGLNPDWFGLPRGSACSLGLHEAISRLWENFIGRHESFWRYLWPELERAFPSLSRVRREQAVLSINVVRRSPIRTSADEVTYNLHIALRFSLERALIRGDLTVRDLRAAWNDGMRTHLGIVPATDRDGVLQDVHWASGAFGYFPTYTLGNVYAANLFAAMARELGSVPRLLERGDFQPLQGWLRNRVFSFGRMYRAREIVRRATGEDPSVQALLDHLQAKLHWLESQAVSVRSL